MIIVLASAPTTRPPNNTGPPLEVGDIWIHPLTGARQRWDTVWSVFNPVIVFSASAPTTRLTFGGGGPLQYGDIWVQQTTGVQARYTGQTGAPYDSAAWESLEPPAGIVVAGGNTSTHLAKAGTRSFDTGWVDPADGIAYLHRQQTAAQTWEVMHQLRAQWVAVLVVDDTRTPVVRMIPSIEYTPNRCMLHFNEAVSGFALVHASKPNPDITV